MVDPHNITNYCRTRAQLEEFLLFCVVAAGKNADQQARKLDAFLGERVFEPFRYIETLYCTNRLSRALKEVRLGKYELTTRAFRDLALIGKSVERLMIEDLIKIPGISLKTAKFFLLHSRANQKIACIDTWVLQFLQRRFPKLKVPRSTPQDPKTYHMLESLFLGECMREGITDIAAADLACWRSKGTTLNPNHHELFRPIPALTGNLPPSRQREVSGESPIQRPDISSRLVA